MERRSASRALEASPDRFPVPVARGRRRIGQTGGVEVVEKPPELLALHDVAAELFDTLKSWFQVPDSVSLDLTSIDAVVTEMADPTMIAALAMRKLQAVHLLATPGVRTTTDVVVTVVQDLTRALLQAPTMRLSVAASSTDWDAALAGLDALDDNAPAQADEADPEAERFEQLHSALHEAVQAVLERSGGEIVVLE